MMASKPVPGVERGDHVYVDHPKRGAMAVKVLSKGRDGFTGQCDKGERHGCAWQDYRGHKKRMLQRYAVVDQGVDGALLEDDEGNRRYLAGEVPVKEDDESSSPENFDTPVRDENGPAKGAGKDDPIKGRMGVLKKADGPVLFFKAGVAGRAGLALKRVTDKSGHQTQRWAKTNPDQKKDRAPAKGGEEPVRPTPMQPEQAPQSKGDAPMRHGDIVGFRHADVEGRGKIVASGADGVTVHDGDREHQVRHEHLTGPAEASGGGAAPPPPGQGGSDAGQKPGAGGAGADGGAGQGGGQVPPDKFDAHSYAAQFTDPHMTAKGILDAFPPDVAKKMADIDAKLKTVEPSNVTYKKDGRYTPERTKLHQAIVEEFMSDARKKAATPPDGQDPTFTILGGRGGSGKSWFDHKVYDPAKAIVLDADAIKQKLKPPYAGWNAAQVHEESSDLFDQMTEMARAEGLNVVHDATMKTADKAVALVKAFKDEGYRTEAHYMYLPPQEAAKRAVNRFLGPTERYVPPGIVLCNKTNEHSFDQVKNLVEAWSFRDNNVGKGEEPKLISEKTDGTDRGKPGRHGLSAADGAEHGDRAVGKPAEGARGSGGPPEGLQKGLSVAPGGGVGPKPLYVSRAVTNGAAIAKHYRDQGCSPVVDPADMHCTVAYSKAPVDWNAMGRSSGTLSIGASDARRTAPLGDKGAQVLHFESSELQARHRQLRARGASHDYPSYQTHVTVSYGGTGFDKAKPWTGPIEMGPEQFGNVKADWKPTMTKALPAILFFKAVIPGGAMGDLLQPVNVAGHVRGGKFVGPYHAVRHAKGDPAPVAMHHLAMTPASQPHIVRPVEPPPSNTDQKMRKLAAIQGRDTKHEVVVTHASGAMHRLGYTARKSNAGLVDMASAYGPRMSSVLGLPADARMTVKGKHELHIDGGHKVHFSGRTQRDSILEGERPHITEAPAKAEADKARAAALVAMPPEVRAPGLGLPRKSDAEIAAEQLAAHHASKGASMEPTEGFWARATLKGKKGGSHDTGIHPTRETAAAAAWTEAGSAAFGVSTSPVRRGVKTHSDIQWHHRA